MQGPIKLVSPAGKMQPFATVKVEAYEHTTAVNKDGAHSLAPTMQNGGIAFDSLQRRRQNTRVEGLLQLV